MKYILFKAGKTHSNINNPSERKKYTQSFQPELCGGNLLTTKRRHQRSLSRKSLGKYWQL